MDVPDGLVAGIYLERTGALAIRAMAHTDPSGITTLDYIDADECSWSPDDPRDAAQKIRQLIKLIGEESGQDLKAISLASYGPFISLMRTNKDFGTLNKVTTDLPLKGFDLRKLVKESLEKADVGNIPMRIHTDAAACALGEATASGLPHDHLLCYVIVTDGIGLGIARGQNLETSALHPELGLLHVRFDRADPLKPRKTENPFLYRFSLAEGASTPSVKKRMDLEPEDWGSFATASEASKMAKIEEYRAYYLSQACLACTVILAPHQIVLGVDQDSHKNLVSKTQNKFQMFLGVRSTDAQPIFDYQALRASSYIRRPTPIPALKPLGMGARVTGAAGMCVAAGRDGITDDLER